MNPEQYPRVLVISHTVLAKHTSMGKTLTNQADNMRERRKQKAKAEALKAPVKIIFPLVIFIFPAIFVVALLPPILSALKSAGR